MRTRKFFYHCISSAWNTLSQSRCLTNIWCMKENENDTTILRDNTDSIIMKQHKRRWMIDTNAMICLYLYLSLTRWTWVWVNSGSWWWTGRPGVLWFMGSQRVGHDWVTELNWMNYKAMVDWWFGGLVAKSCLTLWPPWTVVSLAPLSLGFPR